MFESKGNSQVALALETGVRVFDFAVALSAGHPPSNTLGQLFINLALKDRPCSGMVFLLSDFSLMYFLAARYTG